MKHVQHTRDVYALAIDPQLSWSPEEEKVSDPVTSSCNVVEVVDARFVGVRLRGRAAETRKRKPSWVPRLLWWCRNIYNNLVLKQPLLAYSHRGE